MTVIKVINGDINMSNIAILGHSTRGREVIQLLEMLGGVNKYSAQGNCTEVLYFIYDNKSIKYLMESDARTDLMKVYTLEEFESEFPYKIEDKVIVWIDGCRSICNIQNMEWDSIANEIKYKIQDYWYSTINLQPYKEENMEGIYAYNEINCYHQDFGDKVRIRLGNDFEIKVEDKITYIVKKQPQYPKDYKECCEVLGYSGNYNMILTTDIDSKLFNALYRLKVCRDAYWKIAGEQMGLDKPWEPDWDNLSTTREFIKINKGCFIYSSRVLVFPTEEMRDTFYENFKDLINDCKELL